jgi:hypothetical protein
LCGAARWKQDEWAHVSMLTSAAGRHTPSRRRNRMRLCTHPAPCLATPPLTSASVPRAQRAAAAAARDSRAGGGVGSNEACSGASAGKALHRAFILALLSVYSASGSCDPSTCADRASGTTLKPDIAYGRGRKGLGGSRSCNCCSTVRFSQRLIDGRDCHNFTVCVHTHLLKNK